MEKIFRIKDLLNHLLKFNQIKLIEKIQFYSVKNSLQELEVLTVLILIIVKKG